MKRILSAFCAILALCSTILFISCNEKKEELSFVKANYSNQCVFSKNEDGYKGSKTAYEIIADDYSASSIDFSYGEVTKGELYEISCYVFVENYSAENYGDKNVVIASKSKKDINSNIIYSNSIKCDTYDIENNEDGWVKLKRVVNADSNKIDFSVNFGWKDNKSTGDFYVDNVQVNPISKLSSYTKITSDDKAIEMLFYKSDLKKYCNDNTKLKDYINQVSYFRKKMVELVGDDFTYNKSTFLFTEAQDQFGYAGIPIYIARKRVPNVLKSIDDFKNKNLSEYTYGILHEMSHTFDRICGKASDKKWLFDSEFWADFKVACLLKNDNFKINNKGITCYYSDDYLNNGIYTSEALVKYYLQEMNKKYSQNYKGLSNTLRKLNTGKYEIENNNYHKFLQFNNCFKENSQVDLQSDLTNKQWQTIIMYFEKGN